MRLRLKQHRLIELLSTSGLSQNHWALRIGVARGHWSEIVNGKHPYPSAKTRKLMLEALKVPVEDLFEIEVGADPVGDVDFRRAIAHRYIIDMELGQGGMGAVYLARDVRHGRVVAVKVISPEAVSGIGLNQFHREISTVAQLQHPNILPLFESGDAAGHPFYVMPLVRGGSLRARLERQVRLDMAAVLRLTRGMADALQHAHDERILHCDVKPENVLVHNDHAWVMDFGIARKLHSEIGVWPLRKELDISAGTPAYVSPEQASGDPDLDARSDVYSLGCIVYEMLAGRTPFGGTSTQEIVATRFIVPPPPLQHYAPEVPAAVVSVLERAMALPRDHRPESAAAFAAELEHAAADSSRVLAAASLTTTRAISRARQRLNKSPAHAFGGLVRSTWQDFVYAARSLANKPSFVATAVLTLALGIGASSAVFSAVNGVLLKPLPFHGSEQLVNVLHRSDRFAQFSILNHGPATYFTARDNQRAFEAIGAWEVNDVSITGHGDPERIQALMLTPGTLRALRVRPALGRLLVDADERLGAPLRVLLTHGYWQRRFAGAGDVLGKSLTIDGKSAEIVGVLPASFVFLRTKPALLMPMQLDPADGFHIEFDFQVLGRLQPGVTLEQANADMARWLQALPQVFHRFAFQPHVRPLAESVVGDTGRLLWILQVVAGVVLLIACVNVANLFLIRAERRQQEFAVRTALGASRGRLSRTLLSESALLAFGGCALGLILAQLGIALLRRLAPEGLPRIDDISIDTTVLLFTILISLGAGLLFGSIPVLKLGKLSTGALKEGARGVSDGPGRQRTRNVLVVAQIAMALTLMLVSGLMVRTFIALRQVDPGFTAPDEVQTFRVATPLGLIRDPAEVARTHQLITERLTRIPGVVSAGPATSITLDGENNANWVEVEGDPQAAARDLRRFKGFGPGFFETMGIRLVAGRSITWSEVHNQRPLTVVSEAFAREYWKSPNDAIGKRLRASDDVPWREIIGVVSDERDDGLDTAATKIVYWPLLNDSYDRESMSYAVRSTRVGTTDFVRELHEAVWSVNPNLPLSDMQTLEQIVARSIAGTSFATVMLLIAAAVALMLGVVGIYGVIAYVASLRTREIGVRIALGAQLRDVSALFLRHGLLLTVMGVLLGVVGALAFTRVLSALLFGVGPNDPLTYIVVSAVLAAVALLAVYLPARRASRVDPVIALRAEA